MFHPLVALLGFAGLLLAGCATVGKFIVDDIILQRHAHTFPKDVSYAKAFRATSHALKHLGFQLSRATNKSTGWIETSEMTGSYQHGSWTRVSWTVSFSSTERPVVMVANRLVNPPPTGTPEANDGQEYANLFGKVEETLNRFSELGLSEGEALPADVIEFSEGHYEDIFEAALAVLTRRAYTMRQADRHKGVMETDRQRSIRPDAAGKPILVSDAWEIFVTDRASPVKMRVVYSADPPASEERLHAVREDLLTDIQREYTRTHPLQTR